MKNIINILVEHLSNSLWSEIEKMRNQLNTKFTRTNILLGDVDADVIFLLESSCRLYLLALFLTCLRRCRKRLFSLIFSSNLVSNLLCTILIKRIFVCSFFVIYWTTQDFSSIRPRRDEGPLCQNWSPLIFEVTLALPLIWKFKIYQIFP